MSWTTIHVFVYGEVATAANINIFGTNLGETMPAKVTTKGDMASATGANAIARVAAPSIYGWSPIYDSAQSGGVIYKPQPLLLDHTYTTTSVTGTAAETDTWSYTLAANRLTAKGRLFLRWYVDFFNNYGNATGTYKFYAGATSWSLISPTITISATNHVLFLFEVEIIPLNATNSQRVAAMGLFSGQAAAGVNSTAYITQNTSDSTEDFTASKTLKCSVTHSVNSANITSKVYAPVITLYPAVS